MIRTALVIVSVVASIGAAEARHHRVQANANGNVAGCVVKSTKTSATARVGCNYAAKFQGYVADLEQNYGAVIRDMGGIRRGRCSSGHQHPCGKALDVCQLSRGKVRANCNLPSRATLIAVAKSHGLTEGGQWCSSDMGHVQITPSGSHCWPRLATR